MSKDISVKDITDKFFELEQEIRDLKRDKAQVEHLFAAIVRKIGKIENFNLREFYNSDYDKIRFLQSEEDKLTATVVYLEDEINE